MFVNVDPETGELIGYAIHPNGKKVKIVDCGVYESDCNSFTSSPGYPSFEWDESGEELTVDELNEVIEDDGDKSYLHEWLFDHAEWE